MDRAQIALKLVLDALEVDLDVSTFNKRLALQKATYLVQVAGLDLGYHFSWYLRGPYSTALAQDAYAACGAVRAKDDIWRSFRFAKEDSRTVDKLEPTLNLPQGIDLQQHAWLELLASAHFLARSKRSLGGGKDARSMQTELGKWGKTFTQSQVDQALERLHDAGLLRGSPS